MALAVLFDDIYIQAYVFSICEFSFNNMEANSLSAYREI
jgi:hypothetical protein